MAETLVVVSKVKKMVKEAGFRTGGDYVDALSVRISQLISASIEKVKADGSKKTLGAEDLQ
jgi:hypothetical protein